MKQSKKNSTFKPLWKKPAFIISALIVSVSVFAFGFNKSGQEKGTKKDLPKVAENSNILDSHGIMSFRPMDIMTTPQTLMNVWINEPIPLDQYSEKEKEVQKLINEKTTDGIITYSPLNGNKEYLDIDHEEITPYTWKWIKFELKKPDGTLSKISLRRPNWWITQNNANKVGNKVKIFLPEMGIDGEALVTKITPNQLDSRMWDENRKGDYVNRPITGKFEHQSSDVAYYYFKGLEKPIGATSTHPFWSLDRNEWISVGELKIGETVKTKEGITQLTSKEKMEGLQTVYNLEIYKEHNYFVSEEALLVHNGCGDGWIKKDLYSKVGKKNPKLRKAFEDAMAKGTARAKGEAGIKPLAGKGIQIDGKWYKYELKTAPKSKYGNHRMYGNLQDWTNSKGVSEQRVIFEVYKPSH